MHILTIEQVKAHTAACREVAKYVNTISFKAVLACKRSHAELERDFYSSTRRFWKYHTGHIYAVWNEGRTKLIITSNGELWLNRDDGKDGTFQRVNTTAKVLERIFDIHKISGWYKTPSPMIAVIQPPCTSLAIIPGQLVMTKLEAVPVPRMKEVAA